MYTMDAAYSGRQESMLGRLAPGYLADFIVLSHNVALNTEALPRCVVEEVWVGGRQRYIHKGPGTAGCVPVRPGPGKQGIRGGIWGLGCPCCAAR